MKLADQYANNRGRVKVGPVTYHSTVLADVWDKAPLVRVGGKLVKRCKVKVAFVPGIPNELVWMKDDGSTEILAITRHSEKSYGGKNETERKIARTTDLAREQVNTKKYARGAHAKASQEMRGDLKQAAKDRLRDGVPKAAEMGLAQSRKEFLEENEKELAEKVRSTLQKTVPKPEPRPEAIAPSPELCAPVVDLSDLFDANFDD